MRDDATNMKYARLVPRKGTYPYAIHAVNNIIEGLGYSKMIFKTDQEPSIMALTTNVKYSMDLQVIKEENPAYDHQSNGEAESAVEVIKAQFRAMKDGLDTRYDTRITGEHPAVPWLVAHAAATINRRRVGQDGKTAYRRWKGKYFNIRVAEFGENVWYLKAGTLGKY